MVMTSRVASISNEHPATEAGRPAEGGSTATLPEILAALRQATPSIDLTFGAPHFQPPDFVTNALSSAAFKPLHSYGAPRGSPDLRAALRKHAGLECGCDVGEPLISTGVSGALAATFAAALESGDEVILIDPYFVQHRLLVEETGALVRIVKSNTGFRLPIAGICSAINERTKAILINSPNNPTGVVYTNDELDELVRIAKQNKLLVFSDEIYRDFVFHNDGYHPSLLGKYDSAIVLRGFSKSHGVAGWRIGFVFAPENILQRATAIQQVRVMCAATPLQDALVGAVGRQHLTAIAEIRRNSALVVNALKRNFRIVAPEGGFFVFPELPQGRNGTAFFRTALVAGVGVMPGFLFSDSDTHFRISVAADEGKLIRACEILNQLA